jgi:hypothetical protein
MGDRTVVVVALGDVEVREQTPRFRGLYSLAVTLAHDRHAHREVSCTE